MIKVNEIPILFNLPNSGHTVSRIDMVALPLAIIPTIVEIWKICDE